MNTQVGWEEHSSPVSDVGYSELVDDLLELDSVARGSAKAELAEIVERWERA